jgi:hypothetical protein
LYKRFWEARHVPGGAGENGIEDGIDFVELLKGAVIPDLFVHDFGSG